MGGKLARSIAAWAAGILLTSSLVSFGNQQASASGSPCYSTTPQTTPPDGVTKPAQTGGTYLVSSKPELLWVSWASNPSNTGVTGVGEQVSSSAVRAASYRVTANVDLEDCLFTPISGSGSSQFLGNFDGNGKTISGLYVSGNIRHAGLFGSVGAPSGLIQNLTVEGIVQTNYTDTRISYEGGVVGQLRGTLKSVTSRVNVDSLSTIADPLVGGMAGQSLGAIEDSIAYGNVTGKSRSYVGGLVGQVTAGTITRSHARGTVSGTGINIGGLIGSATGAVITQTSATGDVTGVDRVGGLIGYAYTSLQVNNSFATGNVSESAGQVSSYLGGLIGLASDPRISVVNSYATGNVRGDDGVGGLLGGTSATLTNTYSTGLVELSTDGGDVGGLVGDRTTVTASSSFWDIQTSQIGSVDSQVLGGGTGKSTSQMTMMGTFNDPIASAGLSSAWGIVSGWEAFDASANKIWGICSAANDGYPFLLWEYTSDPCSPSSGELSASTRASENTSNPGIFFTVTARNGDRIATTRIVFGAYSVGKNSPYLVTLQQTNSDLGQRILAQGSMNPGGHLEREIALPALAPGSHKLVFTSRGARGALLTLTNVITVDSQGKVTSVTPEALQPFAR